MFFEWSNEGGKAFAEVFRIMLAERISNYSYTDKLTTELL